MKIGDPNEMERIFANVGAKTDAYKMKDLRAHTGPIHPIWYIFIFD